MYLPTQLYSALANVDDGLWQELLDVHEFWSRQGVVLDAEHEGIAFHILIDEGELARSPKQLQSGFEFDAVPVPPDAFSDGRLGDLACQWSAMHAANFGAGLTTKMGLYVVGAGGTLGYHIDGPVFLNGMRVDLSQEPVQRGLVEAQASHRTILPLRFNDADRFMLCGYRAPLKRGELFEFSNVLPHAYFNGGPGPAVLLVTTYLEEALLPAEMTYRVKTQASVDAAPVANPVCLT